MAKQCNAGSAALPNNMKAFGCLYASLMWGLDPVTAFICAVGVTIMLSYL